jgi:hypothetical protein
MKFRFRTLDADVHPPVAVMGFASIGTGRCCLQLHEVIGSTEHPRGEKIDEKMQRLVQLGHGTTVAFVYKPYTLGRREICDGDYRQDEIGDQDREDKRNLVEKSPASLALPIASLDLSVTGDLWEPS